MSAECRRAGDPVRLLALALATRSDDTSAQRRVRTEAGYVLAAGFQWVLEVVTLRVASRSRSVPAAILIAEPMLTGLGAMDLLVLVDRRGHVSRETQRWLRLCVR